ncbi:MAG: acyltransferase [Clostridia bacterium]|nr:acyltransferase [Clostridia bacterium]
MQKPLNLSNRERNYGLDLLRILSILAVTVTHLLNLSIKLYNPAPMSFSAAPAVMWLMFIAAMFSVNCFGLISGYVGLSSKFSIRKLVGFWLQLFVINLISSVIYYYAEGWLISWKDLGDILLIITKNHYWYMTAYFLLYLCSPVLNAAIQKLSRELLLGLLLAGFLLFSVVPVLTQTDTYYVKDGYSFVWLAYLYVAGGYFARFGLPFQKKHASLKAFACYAVTCLVLWVMILKLGERWHHNLVTYSSPLILILSLFFFNFAASLRISAGWLKKTIAFLAPLVLGIYFIQLSPWVWYRFLPNLFGDLTGANFVLVMVQMIGYTLAIFVVSAVLEYLRMLLFRQARIPDVCGAVESLCKAVVLGLTGKGKEMKAVIKKNKNLSHAVFVFGFLLAMVFCIWKLPYGFGGNDESLYVTLPARLLSGAKLFADEWNLGQFYAVELMPFVWLFKTITGSSEGIMLAMRWVYLALHTACVLFVYSRLKKVNGWGAAIASLLMLVFTPYDIMGMSYNNIALDTLILCGAYLATDTKHKAVPLMLCGALYALSVLGAPFLALLFFLYGIFALCCRRKDKASPVMRQFLFFAAGVVACAAVFLVFMLANTGIENIFKYISHVLNDPQHSEVSSFSRILTSVFERTPKYTALLYGAYALLFAVMAFDRKRHAHHFVYITATAAIAGGCILLLLPHLPVYYYNHIYPPLAMVGLTACMLLKKRPAPMVCYMLIPGLLYGVCVHIGSNQGAYAISMALFAAAVPGIVFCMMLCGELLAERTASAEKKLPNALRLLSCLCLIGYIGGTGLLSVYIKKNHTFQDASPAFISQTFDKGPAKGIASSEDPGTTTNANYRAVYDDMQYLCSLTPGKVVILDNCTWGYLIADMHQCASYSTWMTDWGSFERLTEYYTLRPENKPDYAYFTKASKLPLENALTVLGGEWDVHETDIGYTLVRK